MPQAQTRSRPATRLLAAALALAAAAPVAAGDAFPRTVFFGDSLTDAGYFRPLLVQQDPAAAILGRFTTNPGLVWAEWLAQYYGADATPNGNGQSGDNYAAGGAMVATDRMGPPFGLTPSLATQAAAHLSANGGRADPDALYTVWGGANDLFSVEANPGQAPQIIGAAVTAQVGLVGTLQAAGARYVLVPNIPDLGMTPAFLARGPVAAAQGTALSAAYNEALYGGLQAQGLQVIPLDTFTFLREVVADPAAYGYGNVTGTACQPQITAQSITCHPGTYVSPGADQSYLFADGVHPSSAAHRGLADLAIAQIEGPRQLAVLPRSAAMTGRGRAERVGAQLPALAGQEGRRWWADLRGDFQRYGHGDRYDGVGPALTAGLGWGSDGLVYGGFVGYGRQENDWGRRRGSWDQSEATLGGFVGWQGGNGAWIGGQLSYTRLDIDTRRTVPLGPALRAHRGDTDGSNLTAAVHAGWNLGEGALRHGPVLGLVAQQVEIDGFAEDAPDSSTSLAFPDQEFDSLVGSVGWQASYEIGPHLAPYARLTFDREFEDGPSEAFARSQSTGLDYAVPGPGYDDSWTTLTIGARTRLFGFDANLGVSLNQGEKGGRQTTAFATIGAGF
ncbi:autotransporter domain-containing protein [Luteimonas wenzhouensis]|jgi:outer membrane lipase/esterase|uniref:Autotransporter domain-containing protein n=1 Tax=Luteimonas wenzhouensis TaxID=2599615 RepID=A0A5C5TU12_9GAMM|nr:autotransporter domain-containing protein [Luteimonas wenzhouensis]TWT17703.1 autotransporter domain-containing protein [Luteimonas wenzhouensis]